MADITGWNTQTLAITPPANYNFAGASGSAAAPGGNALYGYGTLNLQTTATALETVGGSKASVSQAINVQVNAIAQVPTLNLNPPTGSVSRSLISTSWEGVCNNGYNATVIDTTQFAGWNMLPVARGKDAALEVWANGDKATNAQRKQTGVQAATGAVPEWLGLSNGADTSTARGAMLDAINLTETLPESASTVYGFAGSPIALPKITDQLAANDPTGQLKTTIVGLSQGVTVSDGINSATMQSDNAVLDVTGWNLNSLTLTVPQNGDGWSGWDDGNCDDGWGSNTPNLQVVATSIEPANGSTASIAKEVTVQLLHGQACPTPAGVNPYVS